MKKGRLGNQGFSLVELIIVIAIMAILVGITAPQLLKYIEKSKVSSDMELLNSIYGAVVYASIDPNILGDATSAQMIEDLETGPQTLSWLIDGHGGANANSAFTKEVLTTLDWTSATLGSRADYIAFLESTHGSASEIYMQYKGGFINPMAMWITYTDMTGKRNIPTDEPIDWQDFENPANARREMVIN